MATIPAPPVSAKTRAHMADQALEKLKWINSLVESPFQVLNGAVLDDPAFLRSPGARSRHHNYPGGLVVHTCEVAFIARNMACKPLTVDMTVLVTAAIWHDYGKIYDYKIIGEESLGLPKYDYTEHKERISHVHRSAIELGVVAARMIKAAHHLPSNTVDAIFHCILSHHGRADWGSVIEPQTVEARILHYADMLSAKDAPDVYQSP